MRSSVPPHDAEESAGMSFDLAVRGGTVVLPETDGVAADIAVADGRIAAVLAPGTAIEAGEVLDATGLTVLPGIVDVHLHLGHGKDIARPRVPEDAATETAAAALGGITSFIPYLMATEPFEDDLRRASRMSPRPAPASTSAITSSSRPRRSLPACRAMCASTARRRSRSS